MNQNPPNASQANWKKATGRWGEDQAAEFLQAQGVEIISRNYHSRYGELDLIGISEGMVVVFEVKTRRTTTFGYPEESIGAVKARHLIDTALAFMQEHPELPDSWRIDVLAIQKIKNSPVEILWFKNAVFE